MIVLLHIGQAEGTTEVSDEEIKKCPRTKGFQGF